MTQLGFFTAIKYDNPNKSFGDSLLERVDNYFYLGGKKAHVMQGRSKDGKEKVILSETNSSVLARVAKAVSYFTVIIPLVMLLTKAVLRSTHSFKLIDPKSKLEKGINISENTISKIQQLMPKIRGGEDDEGIDWLGKGNNLVFRLAESPNLVFKMAPIGRSVLRGTKMLDSKAISEERFTNMIKGKEVCLVNKLGLLIIPHAKKVEIEVDNTKYTLIAEESLDLNPNESAQEDLYDKYSAELNETVRQQAIFIAKTRFNDVAQRNIPILNEKQGFQGPRRIALIDLEHMESSVNGFTGDANGSCGLIRCVSEEQIDVVIEEARKQGVAISEEDIQETKNRRLKELESNKQLHQFYARKGILTGKEPITVDINTLELDLTEEGQVSFPVGIDGNEIKWEEQIVTLKQAIEDVIFEMNKLIQNSSDQASIKGKRYFVLNTNEDPLRAYNSLGLPSSRIFINEEGEKQLWLRRIIQALVDKGHIFKLDKCNGHGYFIQA